MRKQGQTNEITDQLCSGAKGYQKRTVRHPETLQKDFPAVATTCAEAWPTFTGNTLYATGKGKKKKKWTSSDIRK